ncbi:MAG TPA: flavin reductase family protein [Bryobacteraceae bacterium]|nr:flavin reductase family protein [Bryobacteraceae bacterium]
MSSAASQPDAEAFREACALFATGVAIATVRAADGTPHGLTVSSFTSVSMEPPLILVCIDYDCPFLSHFRSGTHFAVNILSDAQRDLSVVFSEKPGGRFEGVDWYSKGTDAPLLRGALATLECRVVNIIEVGDHAVFLGEVIAADAMGGKPLLYFNRDYRTLR